MRGSFVADTQYDYIARDAEVVSYGDSVRLYLCFVNQYDTSLGAPQHSYIVDIPVYSGDYDSVLANTMNISDMELILSGAERLIPASGQLNINNIEMIYYHDGMLFVATNIGHLVYYDVTTPDSVTKHVIPLLLPECGTMDSLIRNHEVKGWTLSSGEKLIGVGNVRTGMNVLRFDSNWEFQDAKVQVYDFDRTLLPDRVINPYKTLYDTVSYLDENNELDLTDIRNNKWDYRVTHSVIPYEHNAELFVLTVDEYSNYTGAKDSCNQWRRDLWENHDLYFPNRSADNGRAPAYYEGKRLKYNFNLWDGEVAQTMCDTSRGNSVRDNWAGGITVRAYSSAEFHCDNSIYANHVSPSLGNDITVDTYGRVVGWGNYPDSVFRQWSTDSLVFVNNFLGTCCKRGLCGQRLEKVDGIGTPLHRAYQKSRYLGGADTPGWNRPGSE
jgi:hypothetical protein